MPELPEVEVISQQFRQELLGASTIAFKFYRKDLRDPIPIATCKTLALNQEITEVSRRGKFMVVKTSLGSLLIHFGMSGRLLLFASAKPQLKHTHLVWTLKSGDGDKLFYLHYVDPRRFGAIYAHPGEDFQNHPSLANLGIEPLICSDLGERLFLASRKRKVPIKSFIMDAKIVVGIGNIYASEALVQSGIHPLWPACELSRREFDRIAEAIQKTLQAAIKQGGTSFKDYEQLNGGKGYFKVSLLSYGRETCGICENPLQTLRIAGRSTWVCLVCQPAP